GPLGSPDPAAVKETWRLTCKVIAGLTAISTVFTTFQKQLSISEKLSKATECMSKLKSIKITLEDPESNEKEIRKEYIKIIQAGSEFSL
ncbi:MAG: hypothetical protein ABI840_06395, partial [bacterium]